MSVNSTHSSYDKRVEQWRTMRDASAGEEAVKEAGTRYLPKLGGQEEDEYAAYKNRPSFYNATGRTIDGLSGMIFRKAPLTERPEAMEDMLSDVTLGGVTFQGFAEQAVEEVLTVGRCGVLVDYPSVEAGNITQAQAEAMNLRPFWSMYMAETILSWQVGQIGNKTVLTQVRLQETVAEQWGDEFSVEEVTQIRVLDLGEAGDTYRQRVFRQDKDGEWYVHSEFVPVMQGRPLDYIPFIFLGPRDTTPHVSKPPLIDLANVNMRHWRSAADHAHAVHFVAAGLTPWARGVKEDEINKGVFDALGPTNIWLTTSSEAEFGILEPTGHGIPSLENDLKRLEDQMAALGARMLAPEKRQAEAAETAAIHRQGEISVLASLSMAVSQGLTKALEIARDWMGINGEVSVKLNTDFLPMPMDPQMLQQLMAAWQGGGISFETLFENLQRGEIIAPDRTAEDEQAEIETSGVVGLRMLGDE